jgi:zinc protease
MAFYTATTFSGHSMRMMIRFNHLLMLAVMGAAACGRGTPPAATDLPAIPFEKYTLANGLEVILSEDHRLPLVAVDVWYHAGPANQPHGRTGFAHLFEHMMFQGSKHVPGDSHFRLLDAAGATTVNGTTNLDRTNYFQTLPSNHLELALWLESDRMGYLLDTIDQRALANQQDVVRNERREVIENRPYGLVNEAVYRLLFPEGHPYHASVMGSHADIQAARLEDVKAFFKQFYRPNNASLAIAGDFDAAAAKALVEKYFGSLSRGPEVPRPFVEPPRLTAERREVVPDRIQLPRVYVAWVTPSFFKPGDAEADVAAHALGGGNSSRLYRSLVYEKQIAQDVVAFQLSLALGSTFQIIATVRPGRTIQEVEAAIHEEIDRFRQTGPEPIEVERATNTFETSMLQGLEVLGGFGGVADTLNLFNHYVGDPGHLPAYIDAHRKVTPTGVKTFAESYLAPSARVVVHAVPGTPESAPAVPAPVVAAGPGARPEAVNPDEPWRATAPPPGPPRAASLPTPRAFTLANGLTVIYHARPGLPVASASLVLKSGGDANPVDRTGLANFTAAMLDQGTSSRDAPAIAADVARIGASLEATSSKDSTAITAASLTRHFSAALDLLADVSLRPAFPPAEVERVRTSRLASLQAMRQDPNQVAVVSALAALFGPVHPYGYVELGTRESVERTTRDDLAAYWKRHFVPANAALVVSGPLDEAALRPVVEPAFGGWPAGPVQPVTLGPPRRAPSRVIVVDAPGAPQTELVVATIGPPRSTPDYPAVVVMNAALGGLASSRLNVNLREKHGYSYGAGSQFVFRKHPGPFWVASAVRTDATAPAVAEILKEVRRMGQAPLSGDELDTAREASARALPADFETTGNTVWALASLFIYGLGLDYYAVLPPAIRAVSADAVQKAAATYLDPDQMVVVAVGDRARIEPGLRKLNLGRLEVQAPR